MQRNFGLQKTSDKFSERAFERYLFLITFTQLSRISLTNSLTNNPCFIATFELKLDNGGLVGQEMVVINDNLSLKLMNTLLNECSPKKLRHTDMYV